MKSLDFFDGLEISGPYRGAFTVSLRLLFGLAHRLAALPFPELDGADFTLGGVGLELLLQGLPDRLGGDVGVPDVSETSVAPKSHFEFRISEFQEF